MTGPTSSEHSVAAVLVIAADPNIESLVGELVAFAGHRPVYDVTVGAAGESVRRVRPDVMLLDTALPDPVVRSCLTAADEVGTPTVLMSSTSSTTELVEEAAAEKCLYFPLPGGPRPLARILDRAIEQRQQPSVTAVLPRRRPGTDVSGAVHPALCAALATVARARVLAIHVEAALRQNRLLRDDMEAAARETRRSRAALCAAVTDYARQLKSAHLPLRAALGIVSDAVSDCATVMGAEAAMPALLLESEEWTRAAYLAA